MRKIELEKWVGNIKDSIFPSYEELPLVYKKPKQVAPFCLLSGGPIRR